MKLSDFIDTIERYVYDGLNTVAEFADAHNMAEELEDEVERLEAENTKLRELVRKMYGATLFSCSECWISRTFNPAECDNENCDNRKDYLTMRELGIEVEDA